MVFHMGALRMVVVVAMAGRGRATFKGDESR